MLRCHLYDFKFNNYYFDQKKLSTKNKIKTLKSTLIPAATQNCRTPKSNVRLVKIKNV
jgi:hypothetical protein